MQADCNIYRYHKSCDKVSSCTEGKVTECCCAYDRARWYQTFFFFASLLCLHFQPTLTTRWMEAWIQCRLKALFCDAADVFCNTHSVSLLLWRCDKYMTNFPLTRKAWLLPVIAICECCKTWKRGLYRIHLFFATTGNNLFRMAA